jgi:hypothetical protein
VADTCDAYSGNMFYLTSASVGNNTIFTAAFI